MSATRSGEVPAWLNFLNGGLAGMLATTVVHPVDLVKTRMQLSAGAAHYKSSLHAGLDVVRTQGILGLYNGISAALLRQASYTTIRLGLFQTLSERYEAVFKNTPNFSLKVGIGMLAGGLAAFVATPSEVALIRMTGDGRLPPAKRRNYKHVFDGLVRIAREEGVRGLWGGWSPTVVRAMILNGAQLSVYSQAKELLWPSVFKDECLSLHVSASVASAFFCTVISLPVDIIKTHLQTESFAAKQTGIAGVLRSIVRSGGVLAFWKGFTPYLLRLGPHTILTFIIVEQFNSATRGYLRART